MSPSRLASLISVAIVASLVGCATLPRQAYTPDEMRAELERRVSTQMRDEIVIPFEIDDEIRALALEVTRHSQTDREKARALVRAISNLTGFSISYDWLSNKTAQEVFRQGQGNCLAYSNLFVGMARAVGLDAVYADVTFIERVTQEAEIVVNSSHMTAALKQAGSAFLIDFTSTSDRQYTGFEMVDDLEAIANFYNNQGFLYGYFTENQDVDFDPLQKELEMYELALEILPEFGRARNNLGVALRRRGRIDEAIEQYRLAVQNDPENAEAYSNMGFALQLKGRNDEALAAYRSAVRHAGKNGYIHHSLGVMYRQLGRCREAIDQFREALSKEPQLADARYQLGGCYRDLGDEKKAIAEFEATLEIDPSHVAARTALERR